MIFPLFQNRFFDDIKTQGRVADAACGWVAAAAPREEGGGQGEAHRAAHVARLVCSPRRWVASRAANEASRSFHISKFIYNLQLGCRRKDHKRYCVLIDS